jgi:hypothetical protein
LLLYQKFTKTKIPDTKKRSWKKRGTSPQIEILGWKTEKDITAVNQSLKFNFRAG